MNELQKNVGPGRQCAVCQQPNIEDLDRALATGQVSQAAVARQLGLNRSAVNRHVKNHLVVDPGPVVVDEQDNPVDIGQEIQLMYRRIRERLYKAHESNNLTQIKAFHTLAIRDLELLAKYQGKLDDTVAKIQVNAAGQVNYLQSAEWLRVREALLSALQPYPDAFEAVVAALNELEEIGDE